ncbi:MAG TPA: hypothetical protein VE570_09335 [Thermoleophilaceae bacterium]|nr:hypothetical protein [Thermoleophilaceae bacterium]
MNTRQPATAETSLIRRYLPVTAAAALAVVLAGCAAGAAVSAPASTRARPSGAAAKVDRLTAIARERYTEQVSGPHSIQTLHSVGRDPALLRLLGSGNLGALRSYVQSRYHDVWYHWHVSRMRIVQGSRVVTEQGVPFCLPASKMTLRGTNGRNAGTLYVSMQDEIGFVRLMHRDLPVQVVIRGRSGQLRTSIHAAALVKLPASGDVTLGGHRYLVRSFHESSWGGEPVTIWILMKG